MKILMLGWELPPHNSGGLGVACYQMAQALAESGVEIDFVLPYQADHSAIDFMNVLSATEIPVEEYHSFAAYNTVNEFTTESACDDSCPSDMRSVQRQYSRFVNHLVSKGQYDAIHAHDWLTMEAGVAARQNFRLPLVVHVHATEFDRSGMTSGSPLIHEIEYHGLMMADRIIAVSHTTKNIIVSRYDIPAAKIEVAHNALDVTSFNKLPYVYDDATYAYLETLKANGHTVVSVITRLTIQKGLTFFMRAAAQAVQYYDRIAFLVVGDGEMRDELIMLAAELGIADKVYFTGFVRGQKWRDAYSISDVFVMSSVSEPFGLTALEAAYHNTALIVTNQSGVSEVINNAFKYDYWDEGALADRLVAIASSASLKQELKDNAAKEYSKISWKDVAETCKQIYRDAAKGIAS